MAATLHLARGENPKIVQGLLGHSNISLTHGHLLARHARRARVCCEEDAGFVLNLRMQVEPYFYESAFCRLRRFRTSQAAALALQDKPHASLGS